MSRFLNPERIFQDLEPKLKALVDKYKNETIYALVISEGVVYIHTEVGLNTTLNEYIEWWDEENKPLSSWQELEEIEGGTLESWSDLDGVIGWRTKKKVGAGAGELSEVHKAELLKLLNAERHQIRLEDTYRSEETREQVRKNIGDWSTQYAIALYGMSGYDEAAYCLHYELGDEEQKVSEYGVAMQELLKIIMSSDLFKLVTLSPDFYSCTQEHSY